MSSLVLKSAESAMFHDLILWLMLIFFYWYALEPRSRKLRLQLFLTGAAFVFFIQTIKQEYRVKLWTGEEANLLQTAYEAFFVKELYRDEAILKLAGVRLNQGWIVSAVMKNVPEKEPFAKGETLKEAVAATLLPRIIWKQKASAGGQENFRRFTGLPIQDETSMGISPLGEGYANFGVEGGIVMLGAWGVTFSLFVYLLKRFGVRERAFFFWLPIIFYQGIKAETEFVVVLNQLFKGAIVAFAFYYAMHKVLFRGRMGKKSHGERRDMAGNSRLGA